MNFQTQLEAFAKLAPENITKVKRMSTFDLFSSIVLETPVDNGVLHNNWYPQLNSASDKVNADSDISGAKTMSRLEKVVSLIDLTNDVYFANNLPYAIPIEFDGLSAKAPQGMVRVNALRWKNIVANNVKKVNV